jgi:hypothetical protein
MDKADNLRKKNFKKGIDSDDARRRREETTIQIRYLTRELADVPLFYAFFISTGKLRRRRG